MKRTSHSRHTNSPSKGLLAGLFLSVGTAAGQATASDQTAIALEKFYRSGAICSLAKFNRIEVSGDQYIAHFDVDSRWVEVLLSKDQAYQDQWLALHCPMQVLPVWKQLEDKGAQLRIFTFLEKGIPAFFQCGSLPPQPDGQPRIPTNDIAHKTNINSEPYNENRKKTLLLNDSGHSLRFI